MVAQPGVTMLSKNGMDLLGISAVNCMCGSMGLMCCKNCWLFSGFWMTKVLCTYLSHSFDGWVAVLMALV